MLSHTDLLDFLSQISGGRAAIIERDGQRINLGNIQRIFGSHGHSQQQRQPLVANPNHVNNLVSMGFEEQRVKRVLVRFRNNLSQATEHLLNGSDDEDVAH